MNACAAGATACGWGPCRLFGCQPKRRLAVGFSMGDTSAAMPGSARTHPPAGAAMASVDPVAMISALWRRRREMEWHGPAGSNAVWGNSVWDSENRRRRP